MFILGPKHNFSQINQCAPEYKKISKYKSFNFNLNVYNHKVKHKKVIIEHISTELMITDPLTKDMSPFTRIL